MTLATFDPFMQGLHKGSILQDVLSLLYVYSTTGEVVDNIVTVEDGHCNGYLAHSTSVPPSRPLIVEPR